MSSWIPSVACLGNSSLVNSKHGPSCHIRRPVLAGGVELTPKAPVTGHLKPAQPRSALGLCLCMAHAWPSAVAVAAAAAASMSIINPRPRLIISTRSPRIEFLTVGGLACRYATFVSVHLELQSSHQLFFVSFLLLCSDSKS